MNHSPELNELATALSAAQGEFGAAAKDSENPHFRSKFASLKSVVQTATPVLAKHGLSVVQTLGCFGEDDTITTTLMHKSGQMVTDTARLHLTKVDPQGHGSAITYMRRYAYMALLGLVADEDDDGNAASQKSAPRRTEHPAEQSQKLADPSVQATTHSRPSPQKPVQVPKAQAKSELLAACGGDMVMSKRLWEEWGGGISGTYVLRSALDPLLERASAELNAGDGEPM